MSIHNTISNNLNFDMYLRYKMKYNLVEGDANCLC